MNLAELRRKQLGGMTLERVKLTQTPKKATWWDDVGNEGDLAELRRRQLGVMTLENSELSRTARKPTRGDDVVKE